MGGAWKALIKSVNRTLKAIARDRFFTEEMLHTFTCEVESISNNRSITSSSDEINDYEAMTPNYILLGYSSSNYAQAVFRVNEINYRKKNDVPFKQQPTCFGFFDSRNIYKLKRWRSCRYPNRQYTQDTLVFESYNRDTSWSRWSRSNS